MKSRFTRYPFEELCIMVDYKGATVARKKPSLKMSSMKANGFPVRICDFLGVMSLRLRHWIWTSFKKVLMCG